MKIIITANYISVKYEFNKQTSLLGRTVLPKIVLLSIVCPLAEHMASLHHNVAPCPPALSES